VWFRFDHVGVAETFDTGVLSEFSAEEAGLSVLFAVVQSRYSPVMEEHGLIQSILIVPLHTAGSAFLENSADDTWTHTLLHRR
jgi:hypothetical protein